MKRNSQKEGHSGETAKGVLRLGVVTMASVGLGHQFCDTECCDDYDRQPVDCGGISRRRLAPLAHFLKQTSFQHLA
jgi:hypothetical protein